MIPKIIHYCWFGGEEIPSAFKTNIDDWKVFHPDWEVIRWDESNAKSDSTYMQSALEHRNWANASNYTRLNVLKQYGGIYMDVDVKVIKKLDGLTIYSCFLGFEEGSDETQEFSINNAVVGSVKDHHFVNEALNSLVAAFDGTERANLSSPVLITNLLKQEYGLMHYGRQQLGDIMIFEKEIFYPIPFQKIFDLENLNAYITENTVAVHLWGRSWYTANELLQRIDDQDLFIEKHLEYIKVLEKKLDNGEENNTGESNNNMAIMIENKLNKMNMNLTSVRDQLLSVSKKSSLIEKSLSEKPDDKGLFFAVDFLSARLREMESKVADLQVSAVVNEKGVQKEIQDIYNKIEDTHNKIRIIENAFNGKKEENNSLQKEISELYNKIEDTHNKIRIIENAFNGKKEENNSLQKEISELYKLIDNQQNKFEQKLHNLKDIFEQKLLSIQVPLEEMKIAITNKPKLESKEIAPITISSDKSFQEEREIIIKQQSEAFTSEISILKSIIARVEVEKNETIQEVLNMKNELSLKSEENEKLNFRVTSLATYIDNFSLVRREFEQRITELEGLIQKMRLTNRAKRLVGLYKK